MLHDHSHANCLLSLILGLATSFSNSIYTCIFQIITDGINLQSLLFGVMLREYLEHDLVSVQHISKIAQSSCQGINNSGESIAVVLLNRWSDDVGVSKLPAAKQMEKLTPQPKLDGRLGVTENFSKEKSHGMFALLCFQFLLGILSFHKSFK